MLVKSNQQIVRTVCRSGAVVTADIVEAKELWSSVRRCGCGDTAETKRKRIQSPPKIELFGPRGL